MELYYKDLISEEASLEKLVDDLMFLVQGANEFAAEAGAKLGSVPREELTNKLERLKSGCLRLKQQAIAGAVATDKMMRRYPYSSVGIGFGVGLLVGILIRRR
jgi:ElaB/YqjD/DUF883 family membrane-anchored ribosome-binding protein